MASIIIIKELANLIGRDDPDVMQLVENAELYPESREGALRILQAMLKQKGLRNTCFRLFMPDRKFGKALQRIRLWKNPLAVKCLMKC